jgi:DnaJ-class molecular chaperone
VSTVRFTTLCDYCGRRAGEYEAWPSCRECHDDVCPDCTGKGSLVTGDGDGPDRVLCVYCEDDPITELCMACFGMGDTHGIICERCKGKGRHARGN